MSIKNTELFLIQQQWHNYYLMVKRNYVHLLEYFSPHYMYLITVVTIQTSIILHMISFKELTVVTFGLGHLRTETQALLSYTTTCKLGKQSKHHQGERGRGRESTM